MNNRNERIKQVRKEVGLSQRAFASRIGVTGSSINKLESGENNPSDQTMLLISNAFGVDLYWLDTGEGEMFIQPFDQAETDRLIDMIVPADNKRARAVFKTLARGGPETWARLDKFIADVLKEIDA